MKNETLTQQTNFEFIRWYSEGDEIQYENGEEWIITKIKPKADKLFIKPYNNIAKERWKNIEIETTFDELLQTIKTKN
jgi:hypothetical protein